MLPAVDRITRWLLSVTDGCALIGVGCLAFIWWALGESVDAADTFTQPPALASWDGTALVLAAIAYTMLGVSAAALLWRARRRAP